MPEQETVVLGFFPPPLTGQAVATERLASLLAAERAVHRINLSSGSAHRTSGAVRLRPDVAFHFLKQRRAWARSLAAHPQADVLWPAVSPTPLGHIRDAAIVLPLLQPRQRVFAVVHQGNFDSLFGRLWARPSVARMVDRVTAFVFLNEMLSEKCARWLPASKRHVIPNTIDEQAIATEDELRVRRLRTPRKGLRLLFLSNMIREKGYLDVLSAAALLHQAGHLEEAVFAGRWNSIQDQIAFEQEVERLGLTSRISHAGMVTDRAAARRLYLNADAFVLPTYYPTEAQPLTILEALATGTPVITTRQGGISEILDDAAEGFFVAPQNPDAVAEGLQRLRDERTWIRLSEAARIRFDRQFHPRTVAQRWCLLLDTLPKA